MKNGAHFPIHVAFRNLFHSQSVEDKVRKQAEKLGQYFNQIMSCHVSIETNRNQHKGKIYHVCVDLVVPNAELVVSRSNGKNHAHEDVYVAIRDAFDAMTRQLKEFAHKQHGEIKHHVASLEGRVLEIAPIADFGYIETINGRRVRFSSKSVIDFDFEKIEIGDRVKFVEAISNDGIAASTVYVG